MAVCLTPSPHSVSLDPSGESLSRLMPSSSSAHSPTEAGERYLHSASKRTLDVTLAVALLLGLLPLFLLVAILVKATSAGPVFFTQRRNGSQGRPFTVIKFRSMTHASCVGQGSAVRQATRNDARVTTVGRFLRRSSIDELPQLFNVLMGDMSLVGPRPHAVAHDEYYAALIPEYPRRFAARPGLSGMAQISGARGETPVLSDMQRRIDFDLQYIQIASLQRDLVILYATAKEMLFSKQAF